MKLIAKEERSICAKLNGHPQTSSSCQFFGYYNTGDTASFGSLFRLLLQRRKDVQQLLHTPDDRYCICAERQAMARVLFTDAQILEDASTDFRCHLKVKKIGYYEVIFDKHDHGPHIEYKNTKTDADTTYLGETLPNEWLGITEFRQLYTHLIKDQIPTEACKTCSIDKSGQRTYQSSEAVVEDGPASDLSLDALPE